MKVTLLLVALGTIQISYIYCSTNTEPPAVQSAGKERPAGRRQALDRGTKGKGEEQGQRTSLAKQQAAPKNENASETAKDEAPSSLTLNSAQGQKGLDDAGRKNASSRGEKEPEVARKKKSRQRGGKTDGLETAEFLMSLSMASSRGQTGPEVAGSQRSGQRGSKTRNNVGVPNEGQKSQERINEEQSGITSEAPRKNRKKSNQSSRGKNKSRKNGGKRVR